MTNTHAARNDGSMSAVQPLCDEPNRSPRSKGVHLFWVRRFDVRYLNSKMKRGNLKEVSTGNWRLDVPGGIRGRKHAAAAAGSGMRPQAKNNRRFGEGWDHPETGPAESDSPKG
jgi:hypothetical protein